jgi:hypothetical protein
MYICIYIGYALAWKPPTPQLVLIDPVLVAQFANSFTPQTDKRR